MKISWLFEIDTYRWSTKTVTYNAVTYTAKVLPDSFDGIQMRWDVSRRGLITPSDLSFEVENTDGLLTRASLEGKFCTIILITDGTESRRWKFKVQAVTSYYGKMQVNCVDILQDLLIGEYPNTPHPREVFPSEILTMGEEDTYRIPKTFGRAYLPLLPVYKKNTSATAILTEASPDINILGGDSLVVYGVKSASTVTMAVGAKAELINFPGANVVNLAAPFALFAVSRSGNVVSFEGFDGTFLKIPATTTVQNISFAATVDISLVINGGAVEMTAMGSTVEVTTSKVYYPGGSAGTTQVLSAGTPNYTVPINTYVRLYGTSGVNEITLNSGSKAVLDNFPGENVINFPANFATVAVVRDGAKVTMTTTTGIVLQVPATAYAQSIVFNDGARTLQIVDGIVELGGVEVVSTDSRPGEEPSHRHYFALGPSATYDIIEVKDPPSAGVDTYKASAGYSFPQLFDDGTDGNYYSLAQFMIAYNPYTDSYDAGSWTPNSSMPLVLYNAPDDADPWNPADVIEMVLTDFGIQSDDIDSTGTFSTASFVYTTQGIAWHGGFYDSEMRETVLNSLLSQCDSSLYISDKVELHPFYAASVETFDRSKTKKLSFTPSRVTQDSFDSGRVHWAEEGSPQTSLLGKAVVPLTDAGTSARPSGEVFQAKFISDGVVAQKLGKLHFQRQLSTDSVAFSTSGSLIITLNTLRPGQVITINDALFGGSQDIIVTSLTISSDLEVAISGLRYGELNEFNDVTANAVTVKSGATSPTVGAVSRFLWLYADGTSFTFNAIGDPEPAEQTITFRVEELNMDPGNYVFTTVPNVKSQSSTATTFTLSVGDFADNESVIVTVQKDGINYPVTDSLKISKESEAATVVREVTPVTTISSTSEPYSVHFTFIYTEDDFFEAVELWISEDNIRANAKHTADIVGDDYTLNLPDSLTETRYLWTRVRDIYGNLSDWYPISDVGGHAGSTAASPEKYLALLSGSITEGELYGDLNNRINLIDTEFTWANDIFASNTWTGLTGLFPDVMGYSQTIRNDLDGNITATETLQTDVENNYASLAYVDVVKSDIYGSAVSSFTYINSRFTSTDSTISTKASITQLNQAKTDIYGSSVSSFSQIDTKFDSVDSTISTKVSLTQLNQAKTDIYGSAVSSFTYINSRFTSTDSTISTKASASDLTLVETDMAEAKAQRTIKVQANGNVVGLTMIAGGSGEADISAFTVEADTFRLVTADSPTVKKVPFIVGNINGSSTVGIDGALVVDGSIVARSINTTDLFAQTISVNNGGKIKSNNYSTGSQGWQIDYLGNAEFNDVTIRGELAGVDINSASGLVVDSSAGIVVNDGASIELNGTGSAVDFDNGFLYCGASSLKVYSKTGSLLELHGEAGLRLSAGSGYNVISYETIEPYSNLTYDLGTTLKRWSTTYTGKINLGEDDLDTYDEGEYTPTVLAGSTSVSLNTSYNKLAYTIIGRQVTVIGAIRLGTVSGLSGTVTISLPVTIGNLTYYSEFSSGSVTHVGMEPFTDTGNLKIVSTISSSSKVSLVEQTLSGTSTTGDKLKTGGYLYISFTYFTT